MGPSTPPSHRRHLRLLCASASTLTVLALTAPAALAGTFSPENGPSPNAGRIHSLYQVALYIAIVIFVAVEGGLFYAAIRFRARRGGAAAQIRGNTRLEATWTLGAALILVVLAVLTFVKLNSIQNPDNSGPGGSPLYATASRKLPPNGKSLNIEVNGQQFLWRFTYPGAGPTGFGAPYSYEEMVVPTNTTVTLDVVSQDVVHSWWVPELGGKVDATPGYVNHTWFKVSRPGLFRGQCAALCGRNHADMVATVRAVAPAKFEAWLAQRKSDIAAANAAAAASRSKLNRQTGAQAVQNP